MVRETSQFLNRIYIGFFILFVLFLIYFYTGNTTVQYAVVTIASVMFIISWWMSSKLFKIIGGAFLLIGFLLAFVSGISFSETIVHIIDNMNLLLFLSLLPFINTVIQVGGMEESIVSLIEDQKGRLDKIYNRTIMTTYVLTIFLNISSIYIVQNVLGKILNGEDRNVRIHFIAKSTLRAFGLAVMWSPIEILVGISIDETGASYFQVIPWIILISIIMYLYEMKKVSTEFSQIQIGYEFEKLDFDAVKKSLIKLAIIVISFMALVIGLVEYFDSGFVMTVALIIIPFSVITAIILRVFSYFLQVSIPAWKAHNNTMQHFTVLFLSLGVFSKGFSESVIPVYLESVLRQIEGFFPFILLFIMVLIYILSMIGVHPVATIGILGSMLAPIMSEATMVPIAVVMIVCGLGVAAAAPYGMTSTLTNQLLKISPYKITKLNWTFSLRIGFLAILVGSFIYYFV